MRRCFTLRVRRHRQPQTFTKDELLTVPPSGWKRKLTYCIAFSADGCTDVTRRYVRSPTEHALPRTRCSEGVLMHITREITSMRRRDMDKKEKFRLQADDMREDAELRKIIIEALAFNVSRILPGGVGGANVTMDAEAVKAAESREEWARVREEGGGQNQNQDGR